ncbi:MAG: phospholipase effector Tle1 domain-containing protein [Flavobacterium sp.]
MIEVATDSSYWNPFSNVALLFDLYKTEIDDKDRNNIKVTLKQYVQGIGTIEGENDNMLGFAFGEGPHGIIGKVWEGCFKVSEEIKKNLGVNMEIGSLTFDVFGFSRGAASARHFCNEILGKQSIEIIEERIFSGNTSDRSTKNDNIQPPKTSKLMKPIGRKYKLGLLGKALQLQKTQHEVKYYEKPMNSPAKNNAELLKDIEKHRLDFENNAPVKIRFVGLFDTVVAQMIIKNHFGKKLDALNMITPTPIPPFIGSFLEFKLDKVRQKIDHLPIKQIVHLIAEDEYRENFASTKVGNAKHIFERRLPGAHSDLGGGYAAMKIDEDIVDYDYITHQTPELPNPKRLLDLKQFLINKGYCLSGEIKAIKTFNYTTRNAVAFQTLFQLIVTRSLTPRFSVIYLNVMKELCEKSGLVFEKPGIKYEFEHKTPPQLIEYERELIENLKSQFEGKPIKPIKKHLPKNLYVHLSSNFNKSKGIERYGAAITGNKNIDTLFYVNAPRYSNPKQDSYERETYTHPQ